jgi:hypothetical protein
VYAIQNSGFKEIYDLNIDPYQLENTASKSPWKSKIIGLEDWRAELEGCAGLGCQTAENRVAP